MSSAAGDTTLPSRDTLTRSNEPETLAIRWVFPTTRGTLSSLRQPRVTLGRGEECDVKLPGTEASRRHAEICREGALHVLRDLKSRNGVFLNGQAIDEAPLAPGHVVRLGEWVGVVILIQAQDEQNEARAESEVFGLLAPGLAGGPALRPILEQLRRAAASNLPIVLLGETGTGKEGAARAVHAWSGRQGPFVAVNCAALPESLAEAELFGYRKGAFTGADRAHSGHFRAAHGGTLFLDEVSDLSETLQPKLLRALERGEVMPLGESSTLGADVRVVTATQVRLSQSVAEHRFRPDLCARLEGLTAILPPLRERQQEISYLFSHLLNEYSGGRPPRVDPSLVEQLCLYDWPYNVRELDLLVRRQLALFAHEGQLRRSQLPEHMLLPRTSPSLTPSPATAKPSTPNTPEGHRARRTRELAALIAALRTHNGNVARAAAEVGVSRQRAYRLMEAGLQNSNDGDRASDEGDDE